MAELSRLMLALKTVVRTTRAGVAGKPVGGRVGLRRLYTTFIFDEVDAGIGGSVARNKSANGSRLSRDFPVLCVTHLPQIACFADHHFYVENSSAAAAPDSGEASRESKGSRPGAGAHAVGQPDHGRGVKARDGHAQTG